MRLPSLIFIVVAAGFAAQSAQAQYRDDADDDAPIYAPINAPFNETARPIDDRTIASRVADELDRAIGDDADSIHVHVRDGRVYLSGYVSDERTRRLVHDAVWTVAGVRGLRVERLYASAHVERDRY